MSGAGRRTFEVFIDGLDEPMHIVANPWENDLIDARERAVLKTWRQTVFAKSRLPRVAELRSYVLETLAPYLMELEVLEDGDLRYVSYGRAIAAAYGSDMTGRRTREFPTPVAKAFLSVYRLAVKNPSPFATRHKPPPPVRVGHWHRLILPVEPTETGRPSRFIVCNVPIGDPKSGLVPGKADS